MLPEFPSALLASVAAIARVVESSFRIVPVAVAMAERCGRGGDAILPAVVAGYEVEIRGDDYLILRERDVHAVASAEHDGNTGLYL